MPKQNPLPRSSATAGTTGRRNKPSAGADGAATALFRDLKIAVEYVGVDTIRAYGRRLRTHSPAHIAQLVASIRAFGFVQPILVDADGEIVGGHGILEAAREAGYATVPVVRLGHLAEAEKRTLRIALNRLAEKSGWDRELLALEFRELVALDLSLDLGFDLAITGFASAEIDQLVESSQEGAAHEDEHLPEGSGPCVSRPGDLWLLGEHRLVCGDAREESVYARLLGDERAAMGIHDPPYDVPISGNVARRGRHREFVMGSGELGDRFVPFLSAFLRASTASLRPGAYQFCFMDWRHMGEMLAAGKKAGLELKNLCVWNKGYGAMGSLYRSQHELAFVFKQPGGSGTNNVQLGKFGRTRTNIWDYPGAASLRKECELHPTPKCVAMIADAIRDVTDRNDIVLDAFSGSGTTIIACAKVGRRGYAVELDPGYVDVGVRRWEEWSGGTAQHADTGLSFAETREQRLREAEGVPSTLPETPPLPAASPVRVRRRAAPAA